MFVPMWAETEKFKMRQRLWINNTIIKHNTDVIYVTTKQLNIDITINTLPLIKLKYFLLFTEWNQEVLGFYENTRQVRTDV